MSEEMNFITPISQAEKSIIKNKTAYALPDRPSYAGMKAPEIKKAFWAALIDDDGNPNVVGLLERCINETNTAFDSAFGTLHLASELITDMQNMLIGVPDYNLGYELSDDGSYYICTGGFDVFYYAIPESVRGIPVLEIAASAFEGCTRLQYVSIPKTIKKIGQYAFRNCTRLRYIYYNVASCEVTGEYRPFDYVGLDASHTTLMIGKDVQMIPGRLFWAWTEADEHVNNLTEVLFESGSICETIGERAFYSCFRLKNVAIPDSVTQIGVHAFRGAGLETLKFGDNSKLSVIYSNAFEKTALETVVLPKSLTTIYHQVFKNCGSLVSVRFLGTPKTMLPDEKKELFKDCFALSDIYVPWSEDDEINSLAPWGAVDVNIHYDTEV